MDAVWRVDAVSRRKKLVVIRNLSRRHDPFLIGFFVAIQTCWTIETDTAGNWRLLTFLALNFCNSFLSVLNVVSRST